MFMRIFNKKGQHTAEYAVMIGIVVAAVLAMQVYLKRGMQGKVKDFVDFMGNNSKFGDSKKYYTSQYEPYYSESSYNVTSQRGRQEALSKGGQFKITGNLKGSAEVENTTRQTGGQQQYLSPSLSEGENKKSTDY